MQTRELVRHLIPIEDAQTELGGIGRTTLYRLIDEGHLVRARIGRRAFITGESIANYIASITEGD
jgi:predicted DNA-binding transcriptional regulator AlpA